MMIIRKESTKMLVRNLHAEGQISRAEYIATMQARIEELEYSLCNAVTLFNVDLADKLRNMVRQYDNMANILGNSMDALYRARMAGYDQAITDLQLEQSKSLCLIAVLDDDNVLHFQVTTRSNSNEIPPQHRS